MTRDNIIILTDKEGNQEAWGSLTEICRQHGYSYNYLKSKKMPFEYKTLKFNKVPFRALNKKLIAE